MRQVLPTFSLGILLLTIGCRHKEARPPSQASSDFSRYVNEMILPFWKAAAEKRTKKLDTAVNSYSTVKVSVTSARVSELDSPNRLVGVAIIKEQYPGSVSLDTDDYSITFAPNGNGWTPVAIAQLRDGKSIPKSLSDFRKELGMD